MAEIKATIFFENFFWVGSFERTDKSGYAVARHIFGGEPSDAEVYAFVLENYTQLRFGEPQEVTVKIRRMNPKRVQREIRKEMEKLKKESRPSTLAQDAMRMELEKNKKEKQKVSKKEREAKKERLFLLKQEKRKEKKRGH